MVVCLLSAVVEMGSVGFLGVHFDEVLVVGFATMTSMLMADREWNTGSTTTVQWRRGGGWKVVFETSQSGRGCMIYFIAECLQLKIHASSSLHGVMRGMLTLAAGSSTSTTPREQH